MRFGLLVMILVAEGCCQCPVNDSRASTYKMSVASIDVEVSFPRQGVADGVIPITIEVTNHQENPIALRARPDGTSFMVRIYDSTGAEVHGRAGSSMFLRENLLYGLSDPVTPPIAPGGRFKQSHDLNKLYVLNTPGPYTVSIYSHAEGVALEMRHMPLDILGR